MEKRFLGILLISCILWLSLVTYFYVSDNSASAVLVQANFHLSGGWANVTIGQDEICGFRLFNEGTAPVIMEKAEVFKDDGIQVVEVDFIKYANPSQAPYELLTVDNGTPAENGWLVYPLSGYQIQPQNFGQGAIWFRMSLNGNYTIEAVQFTYSYLGWSHSVNYTYDDLWFYGV